MPVSNANRIDSDNTEAALNADHADLLDDADTRPRPRVQSWRDRHALKVLGGVMVACFALVIVAQTAC